MYFEVSSSIPVFYLCKDKTGWVIMKQELLHSLFMKYTNLETLMREHLMSECG